MEILRVLGNVSGRWYSKVIWRAICIPIVPLCGREIHMPYVAPGSGRDGYLLQRVVEAAFGAIQARS
jgi:hypothetical protein